MMKRYATLFTALLLNIALLAGCSEPPAAVASPKPGQAMPQFTLTSLDGESTTLAAQRGKVVILHVWASWCSPCRKEMPSLERLSQRLDTERFSLLAVSGDEDANLVREFNRKYQISFARYIDTEMQVIKGVLGSKAFPETFIIGRDGTLLRHMMGEHDWDSAAMQQVLDDAYAGRETKSGAYW